MDLVKHELEAMLFLFELVRCLGQHQSGSGSVFLNPPTQAVYSSLLADSVSVFSNDSGHVRGLGPGVVPLRAHRARSDPL